MFYTLLKFLGWGALLAFIGGCIGWALRALLCRREVAQARASTVDMEEVERMRHRLANLEQVVAERDRLKIQLADVRHADSPGIVGAEVPEPEPGPDPEPAGDVAEDQADDAADATPAEPEPPADSEGEEPSIVPDSIASETTDAAEGGATSMAGFADVASDADVADESEPEEPVVDAAEEAVALDLDGAAAALGKKIKLDDLTVVEGIGPKISELCSGIGVTTWRQLADTDVAELQSMLDAAGSRYAVHKPGTWPQQASLLATGQWAEFKTLTDELDGGK